MPAGSAARIPERAEFTFRGPRIAEIPGSRKFLRQPLDFTPGAERLSSRKHRKTGIGNATGNEWSNGNATHEEHRPRPPPGRPQRGARRAGPRPGTRYRPRARRPAAAVHAALTASPGATTAVIATAAGTSPAAARDALTELQTAGAVTRTKGGKPGIPDTWTLTAHGPAGNEPAGPGQDDEHAVTSQPGDDPASGEQDGSGQQEASGTQASADGDPGPAADQAAQPDSEPAEGDPAEGDPAEGSPAGEDTAASHEQDQTAPPPGASAPAGAPPDPALVAEIAEHIGQIQAAASAAATTLAGGGDLRAVRAGLDEIYEQAAQARRTVRAAAGGRRPRPPSRAGCARRSSPTCAPTPGAASPRTRSTR